MGVTLISLGKLASTGYAALFCDGTCKIYNSKKAPLGKIPMNGGLYCIKSSDRPFAGAAHTDEVIPITELHSRLGHIAPEAIQQMLKDNIINRLCLDPMHTTMGFCESCEYAKAT